VNIASYFLDRNVAEGRGTRRALVCGDRTVSYAELAELSGRAGDVLRRLGVRRGERVLLALSDGVEFVACWYGAQRIGAVTAEVYTFLTAKDYAYFIDYTEASVVVVDTVTLGPLREALRRVRTAPTLLVTMTVYVTDVAEYRAALSPIGQSYRAHFGRHYPAMALIGVSALFDPEAKVELQATAVIPG
jgi:acyl-CoA synthetase (AMP-forming)/AMP-acid ligase II